MKRGKGSGRKALLPLKELHLCQERRVRAEILKSPVFTERTRVSLGMKTGAGLKRKKCR